MARQKGWNDQEEARVGHGARAPRGTRRGRDRGRGLDAGGAAAEAGRDEGDDGERIARGGRPAQASSANGARLADRTAARHARREAGRRGRRGAFSGARVPRRGRRTHLAPLRPDPRRRLAQSRSRGPLRPPRDLTARPMGLM